MNKFVIRIADLAIEVNATHTTTGTRCLSYLTDDTPGLSVSVCTEDLLLEQQIAAREAKLEGREPIVWPDAYLELTAVQRKIAEELFAYDTIVFHGSCVAVDGAAYLFTAKSGTGKSTHTRLWREVFGDRAVMVNDDKPFLKIGESSVTVYGSPWMGKHGLGCNMSAPLKAICILERGEENSITRIDPGRAVAMLLQQSSRPRNPGTMPKYLELMDRLAKNVVFYRLRCNMDPEAARVAFAAMSGEE